MRWKRKQFKAILSWFSVICETVSCLRLPLISLEGQLGQLSRFHFTAIQNHSVDLFEIFVENSLFRTLIEFVIFGVHMGFSSK